MRNAKLVTLGLTLAAVLASPHASAHPGGEDWPFLCQIGNGNGDYSAFRLVQDNDAPNGYGMELYQGDQAVAYVYPSVNDSDDKKFLVVYGAEWIGLFKARERQILAYLSKEDVTQSTAGIDTTWAGGQGEFYMQPLSCRAPTQGE